MRSIKFTVYGEPTPKGRPRFSRKLMAAYTPAKTHKAEEYFLLQALKSKPPEPLTGPLVVLFDVYKAKGMPKSKKGITDAENGLIRPTTKPDLDNYIKILDALNGIFWADDSQIVEIRARKFYSAKARIEVEIQGAI